jgi:hypothetical protein
MRHRLAGVKLVDIMAATGLSKTSASTVRAGQRQSLPQADRPILTRVESAPPG